MKNQTGTVLLSGLKLNRSIQRYIQRSIQRWVEREQSLLFLPKNSDYTVQLDRGFAQPFYSCLIRIKIGSREWKSQENGSSLQDALSRALNHLRVIPRWLSASNPLTLSSCEEPAFEPS